MEREKWKIKDFGDRLAIVPEDEDTIITAINKIDKISELNARMIVSDHNSHDKLLEAMREIITESGKVDITNWPVQQQVCQAIAQKAIEGVRK